MVNFEQFSLLEYFAGVFYSRVAYFTPEKIEEHKTENFFYQDIIYRLYNIAKPSQEKSAVSTPGRKQRVIQKKYNQGVQ